MTVNVFLSLCTIFFFRSCTSGLKKMKTFRVLFVISALAVLLCCFSESIAIGNSACGETREVHTIVKDTFRAHVDYVRMGVGHDLVRDFYNNALVSLCEDTCVCGEDAIALSCVRNYFLEEVQNATLDLWWMVADDLEKAPDDRLFPDLVLPHELPADLKELELRALDECANRTGTEFKNAVHARFYQNVSLETESPIVYLPTDEQIRVDRDREKACVEFNQKVGPLSLTLSATSLTAYYLGTAHQMLLSSGENHTVSNILQEHVRLVYNAARCKLFSGDSLQVPTVYLNQLVTTAHLCLLNASASSSLTLLASFPPLTAMSAIIDTSQKYFPTLTQHLSGLGSSGRTKFISWTGTDLIIEDVVDVLLRNFSISDLGSLWDSGTLRASTRTVGLNHFSSGLSVARRAGICSTKFRWVDRLDIVEFIEENCCSESCLREEGNVFDVTIINEMCCNACNGRHCDVNQLTNVLQVQAEWAELSDV